MAISPPQFSTVESESITNSLIRITSSQAPDFHGFEFDGSCVCTAVSVCRHHMDLSEGGGLGNVGSWNCIQLHLQWHDQHHQGIH